jgi:hypothetical protein
MTNNTDIVNMFIAFLLAFITKDFYDIFIQEKIKSWLQRYKISITKNVKGEKKI